MSKKTKFNLNKLFELADKQNNKELKKLLKPLEFEKDNTYTILIKPKETNNYIFETWHVEDIEGHAETVLDEDDFNRLRSKDFQKILADVEKYHDCEQGINWDVIESHIDSYLMELKK